MVSNLTQYGIFINAYNHTAAAEMLIAIGFYSWVSFAYVSLLQRKMWNPRLGAFAKNYILTEVFDNLMHVGTFLACVYTEPYTIFIGFECCHLFTSVLQYRIRWSLLGFCLRTSRNQSKFLQWTITIVPYIIRIFLLIIACILFSFSYKRGPLICFLAAEIVSVGYDLLLVEAAHYLLAKDRSITFSALQFAMYLLSFDRVILYLLLVCGVALIMTGEFYETYFYLQPLGFIVAVTAYYTTRSFLVSHIEHWLTQQSHSGVDLPSSGSRLGGISLGKSVVRNAANKTINKSANLGSQDIVSPRTAANTAIHASTAESARSGRALGQSSALSHHNVIVDLPTS